MEDVNITTQDTIDSQESDATDRRVPIAEAMRFRQQAQEAEKRIEELSRQLEQLRSRPNETAEEASVPARTAGAKERSGKQANATQAARRAIASGRRADVHEYMRTRRHASRSSLS
jgi:uncharacterized NAD-dependent epimerase/dehydratase family protein